MNRHIKALILFALVLVAAVFYVEHYNNHPEIKSAKPFLNYGLDRVASFEVHHFIDALRFTESEGNWSVQKIESKLAQSLKQKEGKSIATPDAEPSRARNLEIIKALTYLTELKVGEPISTNKTAPDVFQINQFSLQVILKDKDGNTLDTIYIGKQAPEPMSSYVRKNDEQEIYLANHDFRMMFFKTKDEWLQPEASPNKNTDKKSSHSNQVKP